MHIHNTNPESVSDEQMNKHTKLVRGGDYWKKDYDVRDRGGEWDVNVEYESIRVNVPKRPKIMESNWLF